MDTDDDVSTLEEEEASISESTFSCQCEGMQDLEKVCQTDNKITVSEFHNTFQLDSSRLLNIGTTNISNSVIEEEGDVKFQVMCAHTEELNSERFVVYTIVVERGIDNRPAIIERRYSDFLGLYSALRHSHPALLSHARFPRKVLIGNFKAGVIQERSSSFEAFLQYIYSKDILKCSEPFRNFLYRRETKESSQYLLHSQFDEAAPILENLYWLLYKLHSDRDHLLRVLLQLLVCLHAVGNCELAHDYALLALPRFEARRIDGNYLAKDLYVPFLQFCLRLWWMLGRNRTVFEGKLQEVREEGKKIEGLPDLLDSLRDEISVPSLRF